jgi:hypothetical protein
LERKHLPSKQQQLTCQYIAAIYAVAASKRAGSGNGVSPSLLEIEIQIQKSKSKFKNGIQN